MEDYFWSHPLPSKLQFQAALSVHKLHFPISFFNTLQQAITMMGEHERWGPYCRVQIVNLLSHGNSTRLHCWNWPNKTPLFKSPIHKLLSWTEQGEWTSVVVLHQFQMHTDEFFCSPFPHGTRYITKLCGESICAEQTMASMSFW